MNDAARRTRLKVQRQQTNITCSGWHWHCLCARHADTTGGLLDRFETALRNNENDLANLLRYEIENIQKTLHRTNGTIPK